MFERFTRSARDVVKGAAEHAERAGHDSVEEGHLLLALLDREGSRASFVLTALGAKGRRDSIAAALEEVRRRGGMSRADVDALAGLGIDLAEIVSRVEQAHGAGALAGAGAGARGRRGLLGAVRTGPFTPEAKQVLVRALRIVTGQRERQLGDEHLLLSLTLGANAIADVLAEHGVTEASVRRVLHGGGRGGEAVAG
ncbi:Clp protease N-terminal domain-containing protein [Streptomyces sp. NPDC059002]|uniref:Clp protease N-terminal domain-containing protein n=1 Tax=Streptomyces sp. NPDC059002 TaxID=3346690 RepID=UPI0036CFBE24